VATRARPFHDQCAGLSPSGHTHLPVDGDRYLDSDAVFGVKESLIDAFPLQPPGIAPNGKSEPKPYRLLRYRFGLTPA
jgi:hydroxyquinol 1,2-dioxygenase